MRFLLAHVGEIVTTEEIRTASGLAGWSFAGSFSGAAFPASLGVPSFGGCDLLCVLCGGGFVDGLKHAALFGNFRSNWIKPNIQFGSYGVSKTRQLFDADILARAFDARNLTLLCAHGASQLRLGTSQPPHALR